MCGGREKNINVFTEALVIASATQRENLFSESGLRPNYLSYRSSDCIGENAFDDSNLVPVIVGIYQESVISLFLISVVLDVL